MGAGGVLVFQKVGTMKSLHWRCEMWFDCIERKRRAEFLRLQRLLARSLPRRPSRRACVRSYVYFVCVCVYMCICVCVRTCIYVYICMCVCICTSMRLYTCVCVCVFYLYLCIDCGSWYQYFSVWTVSCLRMCFRVHLYAYTYVCGYIYMCIFLQ